MRRIMRRVRNLEALLLATRMDEPTDRAAAAAAYAAVQLEAGRLLRDLHTWRRHRYVAGVEYVAALTRTENVHRRASLLRPDHNGSS